MAQALTVVAVALPAVAEALRFTGQFANVVTVESTNGLRELLTSGRLSPDPGDKLFIFSDKTPADTPQPLPDLLVRLTTTGATVMVVATSLGARDLVAQAPGVGLLEGPVTVNQLLGGIAGNPGVNVTPLPDDKNVDVPLDGSPFQVPVVQAGPVNPFGSAPASPEVAAPSGFGNPVTPAANQATANPFGGIPTHTPATPEAVSPFGAQPQAVPVAQVTETPPANPFSGGSNSPSADTQPPANPFSGGSNSPSADTQPPANPFGGIPTHTPATPEAVSPFGAQPQAVPAAQVTETPPANPFSGGSNAASVDSSFGAVPAQHVGAAGPADTSVSPFGGGNPFGGTPVQSVAETSPVSGGQSSPFGGTAVTQVIESPPASPFGGVLDPSSAPFGIPAQREGASGVASGGPQRRGYVITVTAPKGGTGKSTMSLNLAAYLGLRLRSTGRNVCLVDANIQQADTGKYLGTFTPNVEGLMKDESAIHPDRIGSHLAPFPEVNISALLGPITPDNANPQYYNSKRYTEILNALKPNFDYIIIDTPVAERYHDIVTGFALPNSDFVIVVVAPNAATLMNTDNWLLSVTTPKSHGGVGLDPDRVGWVLNRAEDDIGLDETEIRNELSKWSFLGAIPETREWKRCNNENTLVATKNYHELNQAFSLVLQQSTGEQLVETGTEIEPTRTGFKDRLGRLFKKGSN